MSRLTATQVIDRGDYLEVDFDPNTLTMPYLLSILTFHGIKYPSPYNKGKLVQAFNQEIKPRAAMLKKEKLEREGSIASSRGITDGLTGKSMSEEDGPVSDKKSVPRRSSRRLSRLPSLVPEDAPSNKPTQPKRRRSSAGPSLSRVPSTIVAEPLQPTLTEESEPEEEPIKKVGRPRKSALAASVQARRTVHPDEIEGWSDNNVFQSGAESSSPARPPSNVKPPVTTRRSVRRGRTSLSAPPQMPSSSPFGAPSSATFQPRLSIGTEMPPRKSVLPKEEDDLGGFVTYEPLSSPIAEDIHSEEQMDEPDEEEFKQSPEQFTPEVSQALAHGRFHRIVRRQYDTQNTGLARWVRVLTVILLIVAGSMLKWYKEKSIQIGYCTAGTSTNPRREEIITERCMAKECARQVESHNQFESTLNVTCHLRSLLFHFEPTKCTPCPVHAYCTMDKVICKQSFVLQPRPLAQIPFIPYLLNGLPGFGPVAFPPRCVEDERRRKNIELLSLALEQYLAKTRGRMLCLGKSGAERDAEQWGKMLSVVYDHWREVIVSQRKLVKPEDFKGLFEETVVGLHDKGYIIMTTSLSGIEYIATTSRSVLDFQCNIHVTILNAWNKWKVHILGIVSLIVSGLWMRNKIASRTRENRRVSDLVQVALDTLRNQELLHHTDPVTSPYAYLSSTHLRDLVLQDEHSIPVRKRLWDKVERVVEGNTNVRASMEELAGGDEGKVWKWVGGARSAIRSP